VVRCRAAASKAARDRARACRRAHHPHRMAQDQPGGESKSALRAAVTAGREYLQHAEARLRGAGGRLREAAAQADQDIRHLGVAASAVVRTPDPKSSPIGYEDNLTSHPEQVVAMASIAAMVLGRSVRSGLATTLVGCALLNRELYNKWESAAVGAWLRKTWAEFVTTEQYVVGGAATQCSSAVWRADANVRMVSTTLTTAPLAADEQVAATISRVRRDTSLAVADAVARLPEVGVAVTSLAFMGARARATGTLLGRSPRSTLLVALASGAVLRDQLSAKWAADALALSRGLSKSCRALLDRA